MSSSSSSWVRQLFRKRFAGRGAMAPIRRLTLETLEARDVPATSTWTGGAVPDIVFTINGMTFTQPNDPRWSNPINWSGGVPTNGSDVIFPDFGEPAGPPRSGRQFFGAAVNSLMDLEITINSLTINDSRYGIASPQFATPQTLTITGGITYNGFMQPDGQSGMAFTDFPTALTGNPQVFAVNQATGTLDWRGRIINGSLAPGGAVQTTVGILKLGDGTLRLDGGGFRGGNSYNGIVQVQQGQLVAAADDALGTRDSGTIVSNGATLSVNTNDLRESIEIVGAGIGGGGALGGVGGISGGVTLTAVDPSNPFAASSSATIGGILTISGVVSGNTNLRNVGFLTLSNANTYLGDTFVFGNLTVANDDALSPGGTTQVSGTLQLSGNRLVDDEPIFLNGGTLSATSGGAPASTAEVTSAITVVNSSAVSNANTAFLILSGQLLSAAGVVLTKVGTGTVLFPNANPDFGGDVAINNGIVVMPGADVLGPATGAGPPKPGGAITVNFDIINNIGGTLQVQGNYTVAKSLTINGFGYNGLGALRVFDDPADGVPTNINWAGPLTIGSTARIQDEAGTSLVVSGVVAGAAGQNLTKGGLGALTLTAANTFQGALSLVEGTTTITNSQALGGTAGATVVSSGATLVLDGGAAGLAVTNEVLTLSSAAATPATLVANAGANVWTGLVNVIGTGEGDISVTAPAATLEFSNVVSGNALVRKLGDGTLLFTGTSANTFAGDLQIDAGAVVLGKTGVSALGASPTSVQTRIVVGDGLGGNNVDRLILAGPNQIPDNRSVTVNESGLFDLNGNNETIGALTPAGQALVLAGGEVTTGAAALTLNGNVATLGSTETSRVSGTLSLGGTPRTFSFSPTPQLTFGPDVGPSQFGTTVTFTVTASGIAGEPPVTGSVSFFDGAVLLGSASFNNGVATFSTSALAAGVRTITAVYAGDTYFAPGSAVLTQSVVNPPERVLLTSNLNPAMPGDTVTFNYALSGAAAQPAPTGVVRFFDGGTEISAATFPAGVPLVNGVATFSTNQLAGGTRTITAQYSGDTNFAASATTLAPAQVVGNAVQTRLSSNLDPAPPATPITFTFTATGTIPGVMPAGTATFVATNTLTGAQIVIGTATLVNGTATIDANAAATPNQLPLGTYSVAANYTPSAGSPYQPSSAVLAVNQVIARAPVIQLSSNAQPSAVNQQVTYTVRVNGRTGEPAPGGTVTFVGIGNRPVVTLADGTLGAQITTTYNTPGLRTITVNYNGDGLNYDATSATITQTVNAITTVQLFATSPAPSGEDVTLAFRINPGTGQPNATGTVDFYDGPITSTGGSNYLGSATLGAPVLNQASITVNSLTTGTHTIQAQYTAGSGPYASGPAVLVPDVVITNPLAGRLTSSANPLPAGTAVTFTLSLTALMDGTAGGVTKDFQSPTGTVSFFDGATLIGTQPLDPTTLQASLTPPALALGTRAIRAQYNGDGNFAPLSVDLIPSQVVGNAPLVVITSSANASPFGGDVRFTFTATGPAGAGQPTGTVTFYDGFVAPANALSAPITLSNGQASFTTAGLAPGTHVIRAVYSGDSIFGPTTATLAPNQAVIAAPRVQLVVVPSPSGTAQAVTATFNLARPLNSSNQPIGPIPGGNVQFFVDGAAFGAPVALSNGQAAATIPANTLPPGQHTIRAEYNNPALAGYDPNYQPVAITFIQTVTAAPPAPPTPVTTPRREPEVVVDAVITGAPNVGITKTGPGLMTLNAVNTYTGGTTVNGNLGTLRLGVDNALPDTALLITAGTLNVNGKSDAVASLNGSGTLALPVVGTVSSFVTGLDNTSTTFSGQITGGGTLTKVGAGTLTLSGNSLAFTGTTNAAAGAVLVNANQPNAVAAVQNGAVLGGTGTVGSIAAAAGGTVAPGMTLASTGILTAGSATFAPGSVFAVQANNTTVGTGYDQLAVTGTATLTGATLAFIPSATLGAGNIGNAFTVLTANGGVTGTFSGLPDGRAFVVSGRVYRVNYTATDVTVTLVGLAADVSLSSNFNPSQPGDAVTFTATVTAQVATDGAPTGTVEFFDNGTSRGTATLAATSASMSQATLPITFTTAGSHTVIAVYTPSGNFAAANDAVVVQSVTRVSTTVLQALNGPSVFGDVVTFVATVPRTGATVPTGSFNFFNATTGEFLGTVGLNGFGQAAFSTSGLRPGTNTIRAVYSGDGFYRASSGEAVQVVDRQARTVVGSDAGPVTTVQVFDPRTGALLNTFQPFDQYTGGVKVATGDVNNDGISDIIVSAGAGAPGGHVKVYSGADYSLLSSFFSFEGFRGGVNVGAGDVNGDGFADIIVGTGAGAATNGAVKVFSGRDGSLLSSFLSFAGYDGGVTVGAGDVDGDGRAEVIVGSASSAGHVKVFQPNGSQIGSYFAYGTGYLGGIFVAGGDLDGDGRAEIITGATNAPHVKALNLAGQERASFFAYLNADGSPANFGVRVGAVDRNGDRLVDILTGSGGGAPAVKVFSGLDSSQLIESFIANPAGQRPSASGIFVGGSGRK